MGLVLLPLFLLSLAIWGVSLGLFIKQANKGIMASKLSIPLSLLIIVANYSLLIVYWSSQKEIWALTPMAVLPITHIILPGALGIGGIFIPKRYKWLNILGFALCLSALISGILFVGLPDFSRPDYLFDINVHY